MTETSELHNLIAKLPEIYQPIYGHDSFSKKASRNSEDRLKEIVKIQNAMREKLGRSLNILDLGCAQGYMSMALASLGNNVTGIDHLDANIALCKFLAKEHPDFSIKFEVAGIENILPSLFVDQYDMILGLSVFHHIIQKNSEEFVISLLSNMASKVGCAVFEIAVMDEPADWAGFQPRNPSNLLKGFAFVHQISTHPTHLSNIERPIFFASNKYWYLDGQMEEFERWTFSSHHLVQNNFLNTRKYFFSKQHIAKLFSLETEPFLKERNLKELTQEAKNLGALTPDMRMPYLVTYGKNNADAWLIRELLPGELLSDRIQRGTPYNPRKIIMDVLDQLCILESKELMHNDLRAWNILITSEEQALIIDYGSIDILKQDVAWPYNLFLSFWIFIHEVTTGNLQSPFPQRPPFISPFNLQNPYKSWAERIWSHPEDQWSFQMIRNEFYAQEGRNNEGILQKAHKPNITGISAWMKATEEYLYTINEKMRNNESDFQIEFEKIQEEHDDLKIKLNNILRENESLGNELGMVYQSRSYRITAPLRYVVGQLRILRTKIIAARNKIALHVKGSLNSLLLKVAHNMKSSKFGIKFLSLMHRLLPVFRESLITRIKESLTVEDTASGDIHQNIILDDRQRQLIERFRPQENSQAMMLPKEVNDTPDQQSSILIDVTLTSIKDIQTGVQRVVKNLSRSLLAHEKQGGRFRLIHQQEKKVKNAFRFTENLFYLPQTILGAETDIKISSNDTLFLLDAGWERNVLRKYVPIIKEARKKDGRVLIMIYDILPLKMPEYFTPHLNQIFREWMDLAIEYSDELICISKAVADDVLKYIKENHSFRKRKLEINYFHLGCDIETSQQSSGIREPINKFIKESEDPIFLVVGTIEPRKGHPFVLDVFERLWKDHKPYRLCFAGKFGWHMEETRERILEHAEMNRRFLFVESPTDSEINALYSGSTAIICASTDEGFGLPIIEAAQHGVPAIVSDIPVFREVGKDGVHYFPLGSSSDLMKAVQKIGELNQQERISMVEKVKPLTWDESGEWMLEIIGNQKPYIVLEAGPLK